MTILFFDTETSGLPIKGLPFDHPAQPKIVQLAAILTQDTGEEISSFNVIIDNGVDIPTAASQIHGITTDMALWLGIKPKAAAYLFNRYLDVADLIVAHNIKFDLQMLELQGIVGFPLKHSKFCTMDATRDICQLPPTEKMVAAGFGGYKAPKMSEAYAHFFGKEFDNAHNAMADVTACKEVFFKLEAMK